MSLHITPEMCEAMYSFLLTTPPFRAWYRKKKLPPPEEVSFHIVSSDKMSGDQIILGNGTHRIRINDKWVGTVHSLYATLAHEMVHVYLDTACPSDQAAHGWRFKRTAASVCRHHVLSEKAF